MQHDQLLAHVHVSLFYIKATMNNLTFKVMIDSGAQTSVMSHFMYESLQLDNLDKRHRGMACGVGQAQIHGIVYGCQLMVANQLIRMNFKVMDTDARYNKYMILLGADFLESYGCVMDFRNKTILINDTPVQFLNEVN